MFEDGVFEDGVSRENLPFYGVSSSSLASTEAGRVYLLAHSPSWTAIYSYGRTLHDC